MEEKFGKEYEEKVVRVYEAYGLEVPSFIKNALEEVKNLRKQVEDLRIIYEHDTGVYRDRIDKLKDRIKKLEKKLETEYDRGFEAGQINTEESYQEMLM